MSVRILTGDCRDVLRTLPDESVHCVVTSPPYFGLRDYGTAKWEGGDKTCDHAMPVSFRSSTLGASTGGRSQETHERSIKAQATPYAHECKKCGASRIDSQIGLEPTPDAYVAELVAVFREIRRVLRADGTCWLVIGDSYCNFRTQMGPGQAVHGRHKLNGKPGVNSKGRGVSGLKEKDLIGIPWRVAFALQADGWWLRQDIIWSKPNPMPESVTDRCTKSHEYIFLLTKAERYFYDADAISEPNGETHRPNFDGVRDDLALVPTSGPQNSRCGNRDDGKRNRRSVWTIPSQPYPDPHFATFPPALIEPCIKAGCPAGGTVLDPFGGAGTTGLVADRLGRNTILIELNPEYAAMAGRRLHADAGMFGEVVAA